jgi:hypothetical protein
LALSPVYLAVIPRNKADYFNTRFDLYGDSYSEFLNMRELNCILKQMELFDARVDQGLAKKL